MSHDNDWGIITDPERWVIFDVDGTLTPSRGVIEPNFAK